MAVKPASEIQYDPQDMDGLISNLESIIEHRKKRPTVPSSLSYYETQLNYYKQIKYAHDEGKQRLIHTAFAPVEIINAFNLVPAHASFFIGAMAQINKKQAEYLESAHRVGLPWELCGGHRPVVGGVMLGRVPMFDLALSQSFGCLNAETSVTVLAEKFKTPIYHIELPYGHRERDYKFIVKNYEELIEWLELQTGRKMDWNKFEESIEIDKQTVKLVNEIRGMRTAKPSPMKHRSYMEQYQTEMFMPGTPECLKYYTTVRDEIREYVNRGIHPLGPNHKEKYRIISLFMPPNWARPLMDWMEEAHGVSSVAEPHMNEWELEPILEAMDKPPLEFLAIKNVNRNFPCMSTLPMTEGQLPMTLRWIKERQVDSAIYYASVSCHTSPALIRTMKDSLWEAGRIPILVLDNDVADPAYCSMDEMKERIEGFLDSVDSMRNAKA